MRKGRMGVPLNILNYIRNQNWLINGHLGPKLPGSVVALKV